MITEFDTMRREIYWLNDDIVFYTENIRLLELKLAQETVVYKQGVLEAVLASDRRLLTEKQDRRQELLG